MVAEKHPRRVPASYLVGASCLLPGKVERADLSALERLGGKHQPSSRLWLACQITRLYKLDLHSRCQLIARLLT